jgi:hypothetical protein
MLSKKHLPNKIPNERIEIFLKRHWFIFLTKILFHLVLFILPLVFYMLIGDALYGWHTGQISRPLFILAASVYYLSVWLFFASSFINDFLDYWIVTNNRIISINQKALFSRTVGELKLSRVQDVTCEVHGFFATILHYGDIHVQSAGTKQPSVFKQVPRATKVAQDILHLVEKNKCNSCGGNL